MKIHTDFPHVSTALLTPFLFLTSSAIAVGQSTCAQFGAVPINSGQYTYQQDEWNSTALQCATVNGVGFTLSNAEFDLSTSGAPATHPSVFRGCHWGACTSSNPFPIQESNVASASTSVSITQPSGYNNDAACDIWFNPTSTTSGQPNGTEIMIWLNHQGIAATLRVADRPREYRWCILGRLDWAPVLMEHRLLCPPNARNFS